jgi:nucleoid-associated protein YgaU
MAIFEDKRDERAKNKPADFSNVNSGSDARTDKPAADFSNVKSGSSSTDVESGAATSRRTYTVVKGDSLSAIAKREYGDANKWHAIYEANKDTIKDPDLIHPGQTLRLP